MDFLTMEAWLTLAGSEMRDSNLGICFFQKMALISPPQMSLLNKITLKLRLALLA